MMTPETFKAIQLASGMSDRQLAAFLRIEDLGTIRRYKRGVRAVSGPVAKLMEMLTTGDRDE